MEFLEKGIRTFIDGIPVDFLGAEVELNNISSNIIKQIEIPLVH